MFAHIISTQPEVNRDEKMGSEVGGASTVGTQAVESITA
jgi:hypothetical protein